MVSRRLILPLMLAWLGFTQAAADEARWAEHIRTAGAALCRGDYREAERQTEAAVEAAEAFGEQDWRFVITLEKLAGLYRAQGRYNDAAPLYLRLLVIDEKALGARHPNVTARVNDMAALYRAQGRNDEAERVLRGRR